MQIHRELRVPVPASRVWTAITEPEALRGWLGADVEWEIAIGATARFSDADGERRGVIAGVEPGRRLSFLWWPRDEEDRASEVTFDLEDEGDATVVRVTERPVEQDAVALAGAHSWLPGTQSWLPDAQSWLPDARRWGAADLALLHVWARCCPAGRLQTARR